MELFDQQQFQLIERGDYQEPYPAIDLTYIFRKQQTKLQYQYTTLTKGLNSLGLSSESCSRTLCLNSIAGSRTYS